MPDSPPAKKQPKTEEEQAARDDDAAGGGGGALSIEMIGEVASFANYGDDLMNICKAVGRKDSAVIRHACLRNNMDYLRYTLENFADNHIVNLTRSWLKREANVTAWMGINSDWRKLSTLERTADEEISTCAVRREISEDDDDQPVAALSTNPLVLFNNPAVATELGFNIILMHLVEEVGIDINSNAWCNYATASMGRSNKTHLLTVANAFDDVNAIVGGSDSSFDYLLSREETKVHVPTQPGSGKYVWQIMYESQNCNCKNFRALVEHSSFDPNRLDGDSTDMALVPLVFALMTAFVSTSPITGTYRSYNSASADILVRKFKILLDVGADPELVLGAGTVLEDTKVMLSQFEAADTNPLGVQVGRQMIEAMEEKVASGNGSE